MNLYTYRRLLYSILNNVEAFDKVIIHRKSYNISQSKCVLTVLESFLDIFFLERLLKTVAGWRTHVEISLLGDFDRQAAPRKKCVIVK